jgi:cyclopropane fatty-acyl-phospholipid synthase-like methyltransferase
MGRGVMAKGDPTLYKEYLGGHNWITHTDQGALKYIIDAFDIKSMLDIGCGPGDQIRIAKEFGIDAEGVDGDIRLIKENSDIIINPCDYTKETYIPRKAFDLVWSTEFVEHVREEFVDNFMRTFSVGKYVFITYAPEGKAGNHHVNCRNKSYWIDIFAKYNFVFNQNITDTIKTYSTMKREFVRDNGLFFSKET